MTRPTLTRIVVLVSVVAGVLVTGAAPSGAAPKWSISPSPAGPPIGELSSVSCATRTQCTAVGNYGANEGFFTLIERGT